jgi:hypothetical protein
MDVNSLRMPRMQLVGEGQHAVRPRPRTPSRPGPSPAFLRQSSRATGCGVEGCASMVIAL